MTKYDIKKPKRKSSFFLPMRLLKGDQQKAMHALYALCRALDDVTDEIADVKEAKTELALWKKDIAHAYQGKHNKLQFAEVKNLAPYIVQFKLPKECFDTMLEGFKSDIDGKLVKPTLKELENYAYAVASCVGLLSIHIFGYKHKKTLLFAEHLGKGLQYINIIRDVQEDAEKGRIYLPKELLKQADLTGVTFSDLVRGDPELMKPLGRAKRTLATLALKHMEQARKHLNEKDAEAMKPALLMQTVYLMYLNKMQEQGFERLNYRLSLSLREKAKLFASLKGFDLKFA